MTAGAWVTVIAVVVALSFGTWRLVTDGRFRGTHHLEVEPMDTVDREPVANLLEGTQWADELGERATLLQFSSAFCAPCRATRRVLSDVAATDPTIHHVEVDAELHLDLVRRVGVLRTPTTLVLGRDGQEVGRAVGAPTHDQVARVLAGVPDA